MHTHTHTHTHTLTHTSLQSDSNVWTPWIVHNPRKPLRVHLWLFTWTLYPPFGRFWTPMASDRNMPITFPESTVVFIRAFFAVCTALIDGWVIEEDIQMPKPIEFDNSLEICTCECWDTKASRQTTDWWITCPKTLIACSAEGKHMMRPLAFQMCITNDKRGHNSIWSHKVTTIPQGLVGPSRGQWETSYYSDQRNIPSTLPSCWESNPGHQTTPIATRLNPLTVGTQHTAYTYSYTHIVIHSHTQLHPFTHFPNTFANANQYAQTYSYQNAHSCCNLTNTTLPAGRDCHLGSPKDTPNLYAYSASICAVGLPSLGNIPTWDRSLPNGSHRQYVRKCLHL